MDAMDEKILNVIEKNSRIDTKDLAVMLGTEEAEIQSKLRQMEEKGVICGYHTMVDWDKTGVDKVTAMIEVHVTPQRGQGFDKIAERIYKYPEVESVYLISGSCDLMVTLAGKTFKEVALFVTTKLSTLETVTGTQTSYVLKKYKDHGTILDLPDEDKREMITP